MLSFIALLLMAVLFKPITSIISHVAYRPVAGDMVIHERVPDGGKGSRGWSLVFWSVTKHKPCEYRGMEWQGVMPDGRTVLFDWENTSEQYDRRNPNRPTGDHEIVTRVGSTMHEDNWKVVVRHKCHWMLPEVYTTIWPPIITTAE